MRHKKRPSEGVSRRVTLINRAIFEATCVTFYRDAITNFDNFNNYNPISLSFD
ncbi:hypothetical protein [Tolypothrix sp. VBCCA 56010]|uniref:hypothetical protein n=1 Tax=Tolypothrix sp. VBCCA 56010 TaxID=3137731 RepID=UPI003D7C6D12